MKSESHLRAANDDWIEAKESNEQAGEEVAPITARSVHLLRHIIQEEIRASLSALGVGPMLSAGSRDGDAGEETVTVKELARLLGIERKTLYNQINLGQIPGARRLGRRIVVHRRTVLDWLANGQGSVPRSRRKP